MISRVESGRQKADIPLVRALLDVYGVQDPALREALEAMARNISARGWWHTYASYLNTAHQDFFGLESDASGIRQWELSLIPGLLQTAPYTRALLEAGVGILHEDAEQLDRRVQARMERKRVLDRGEFTFEAVISAAAFRTAVGGESVMRDQLEHLLAESERPNVSMRVMPLDSGFHLGLDGSFAIIRFPDAGRLINVESLVNTMYLEDEPTLDAYDAAWTRIVRDALAEKPSRDLIRDHVRAL